MVRTERLRLEPIGPGHARDVELLHRDPSIVHWVDGPFSPAQAEAFAARWHRRWSEDSVGKWMAYLHDGTLVGRGGLSRLPADGATTERIRRLVDPCWHADRLELGWALRTGFHGRGYATELGRAGLAYATEVPGACAVVAFTERHNVASRRVMERLGMAYAGEIAAPGLVEGSPGLHDDAPFAVYVS